MNNYYTYIYFDADWVPYYVGKGRHNRKRVRRQIEVPPNDRIQVFYFDEEWKAFECEIELISFFGRTIDDGTLQNVATGGVGCPGVIPNAATRKKLSELRKAHPRTQALVEANSKCISLVRISTGEVLTFNSQTEACKALGLHRSSLYKMRHGFQHQHHGYKLAA